MSARGSLHSGCIRDFVLHQHPVRRALLPRRDGHRRTRFAAHNAGAGCSVPLPQNGHHRSQIDPAVLARFDSALSDIDRTIQETRQVVRRNPEDPVALQYLLSAYARKVDTLRAMALD